MRARPLLALVAGVLALLFGASAGASDFERYHPDQRFRRIGMETLERGDAEWALRYFRRAALYADKPSQAMIGEMYWEGSGVAQDRAVAYAWMDLAAERHYKPFLLRREVYWEQLDAAERARALEVGAEIYAKYGDVVAKPKLEAKLRRGRRSSTGSRTGFQGALRVYSLGPGGEFQWDPEYYAARHWDAEAYWEEQDRLWRDPPRGIVTVAPVTPDYAVPERASPQLPPPELPPLERPSGD